MLTPAFKIDQDNNNIFLSIKAPYTNVSLWKLSKKSYRTRVKEYSSF